MKSCGNLRLPAGRSTERRSQKSIGDRTSSGKTSMGHHGTRSLGCAGQTVRPSLHSISQTSVGKLSILNYSVSVLMLTSAGSREAIPSEPPSLARPMRRVMVAERGGGHLLGEPERAFVMLHG